MREFLRRRPQAAGRRSLARTRPAVRSPRKRSTQINRMNLKSVSSRSSSSRCFSRSTAWVTVSPALAIAQVLHLAVELTEQPVLGPSPVGAPGQRAIVTEDLELGDRHRQEVLAEELAPERFAHRLGLAVTAFDDESENERARPVLDALGDQPQLGLARQATPDEVVSNDDPRLDPARHGDVEDRSGRGRQPVVVIPGDVQDVHGSFVVHDSRRRSFGLCCLAGGVGARCPGPSRSVGPSCRTTALSCVRATESSYCFSTARDSVSCCAALSRSAQTAVET